MIKQKKAQTELIGLVVVVLLITLGMLFYLRFMKSSNNESFKQDFTDQKLASSVLSVILRTTEGDMELRNHYKLCADNPDPTSVSCRAATTVTTAILSGTLDTLQRDYKFTATKMVSGTTTDVITPISSSSGCTGDTQSESFLIPTASSGPLTLTLKICR